MYWYHNDKILNYDTSRTRVSFDQGNPSILKARPTDVITCDRCDGHNEGWNEREEVRNLYALHKKMSDNLSLIAKVTSSLFVFLEK